MIFLLRCKLFPLIQHQLEGCLQVIGRAKIELPKTSKIRFPDKFSQACNACWGKKADGYEPEPVDDNTLDEPKAKRQKCDPDIPLWANGSVDDWGAAAVGVSGSSWGQDVDENYGWGPSSPIIPEDLLSLLGPTVLPLTHTTGIVERSMRWIVSMTPPSSSLVAKSPPLPEGICEPNADAVELELDRRFAKVVLAPMIDWDGGESPVYTNPTILTTSLGAVVDHQTPISPTSPQPHDPKSDEITLLIDDIASQIDYLREGMAIGGTWVQLVRQGDQVAAKKKGKSKKSSYWYMDEFALMIPSFWTIGDDR